MCSIPSCPFDVVSIDRTTSTHCLYHQYKKEPCVQCQATVCSRPNRTCPPCTMTLEKKVNPIMVPLYTYHPSQRADADIKMK